MSSWTQIPSLRAALEKQIRGIIADFPRDVLESEIEGIFLVGSCSEGKATYRSDLDLLVVLKNPPLKYGRVVDLREKIEAKMPLAALSEPLACEFHFVLPDVADTSEPAMMDSISKATILIDPYGKLKSLREKILLRRGAA